LEGNITEVNILIWAPAWKRMWSGPRNSSQNVADIWLITAGGSCNINMPCMCSFWILLPH